MKRTINLDIQAFVKDVDCLPPLARLVWLYLLFFMEHSKQRGYLEANDERVRAKIGISMDEYMLAMRDLEKNKIFSVTSEQQVYCRRMVREEKRRDRDKEDLQRLFETLLEKYPNATGVMTARVLFEGKCVDGTITTENFHEVMEGLQRWRQSRQWQEGFVPALPKWLSEEMWRDRPMEDASVLPGKRSKRGTNWLELFDPEAED